MENQLKTSDVDGLFKSLKCGLECLGDDTVNKKVCKKLVGIATDETSVSIASECLKGLVEQEFWWIFCMWCLAHRLELAIDDELDHHIFFKSIDKMLLQLYHSYEKSPKSVGSLKALSYC